MSEWIFYAMALVGGCVCLWIAVELGWLFFDAMLYAFVVTWMTIQVGWVEKTTVRQKAVCILKLYCRGFWERAFGLERYATGISVGGYEYHPPFDIRRAE